MVSSQIQLNSFNFQIKKMLIEYILILFNKASILYMNNNSPTYFHIDSNAILHECDSAKIPTY